MKDFMLSCLFALMPLYSMYAYATCVPDLPQIKPNTIYIDHMDGTVTDIQTGLMWQKCSVGQLYSEGTCTPKAATLIWHDALKAATTANTAKTYGYSNWRLPNIKELASLIETACYSPAINSAIFPLTPSERVDYYWSSTSHVNGGSAWHINMHYGSLNFIGKKRTHFVRLVRRIQ